MTEQEKLEYIKTLPTEFSGCAWNDGWEFEMPIVIYSPKKYMRFASGGSAGEIESVVEDICMDLACELPLNDGGLKEECKWRHWSVNRFAKRKNAEHRTIKVKWFIEDGEIEFEFVSIEKKGV